jgi:uncharacterized membrane protein
MPIFRWLSLLATAVLLVLLPFLYGGIMLGGLGKLHINPKAAIALTIAIIIGGFINIPVRRIVHQHQVVVVHPLAAFGLSGMLPRLRRVQRETIIAVNVGGCLIPLGIAAYELSYLAAAGRGALAAVTAACAVNALVCYVTARPVPGVGIVMPGLLAALVAAGLALVFAPAHAAPVAFVAGVVGPLVGADLLHLTDLAGKNLTSKPAGIMSIGGAGTFDGIVLSGIVAAYLT